MNKLCDFLPFVRERGTQFQSQVDETPENRENSQFNDIWEEDVVDSSISNESANKKFKLLNAEKSQFIISTTISPTTSIAYRDKY